MQERPTAGLGRQMENGQLERKCKHIGLPGGSGIYTDLKVYRTGPREVGRASQ